jgi:hypothetical protein
LQGGDPEAARSDPAAGGDRRAAGIKASIAPYVVALVLRGLGGQRPKQARRLASGLAVEHRPARAQLRALIDDRPSRTANYTSALAVRAILAMVFKP